MSATKALQTRVSPFVYSRPSEYLRAVQMSYGPKFRPVSASWWAKKMGMPSHRRLELAISGSRCPSEDLAFLIIRDLKLVGSEEIYFRLMIRRERQLMRGLEVHSIEAEMSNLRPRKFEAQYINNEIFARISEWYPLVIRQLSMTKQFKRDAAWIQKRLGGKVTMSQISSALAELENLALDRRSLYTAEDVPSQAVRTFHKKILYRAIEVVDEVPVDSREYIAMTFRSSPSQIPLLKQELRKFRDQFNSRHSREDGTEVYQLNISFFPHTRS